MNSKGVISTQASVTIQCTQDTISLRDRVQVSKTNDGKCIVYKTTLPHIVADVTNIRTKELVYHSHGTSRSVRGAIPVHSILNGLYVNGNPKDEKTDINELSKSIRFIGVACTPTNLGDASDNQTQLTVRTRGTETILNTSTEDINVGDTIMWEIPTKEQWSTVCTNIKNRRGNTPAYDIENEDSRVLLMTVPFKHKSFHDALSKLLVFNLVEVETIVENHTRKIESHKIGKALSSAKSGCPFDIMLC